MSFLVLSALSLLSPKYGFLLLALDTFADIGQGQEIPELRVGERLYHGPGYNETGEVIDDSDQLILAYYVIEKDIFDRYIHSKGGEIHSFRNRGIHS